MIAELLQKATKLAEEAHANQLYGDKPYMTHVMAVVQRVRCASNDPLDAVVAMLHDVVEDSDGRITIQHIEAEFGRDVAKSVDHLTRRKGESYMDYIRRLSSCIRARRVKMCDLAENMHNLIYGPVDNPYRRNLARYRRARVYIAVYDDQEFEEVAYA